MNAIGMIEYRSIAKGVEATDAMLKSGSVRLIQCITLCPGKHIAMVSGDVSAVNTAVETGKNYSPGTYISSFVIANVHEDVIPALVGTTTATMHDALGIIETADASNAILAGDAAAKAANIELLEIRLARGMGGKGIVYLCGELSAVRSSVEKGARIVAEAGMLIATSVIAAPSPGLYV